MRRLYALVVVLVMTAALGWQLWRAPTPDPGRSDGAQHTADTAQSDASTAHQRTVSTIVGTDSIRVVEHLTFTTPTDTLALENPKHRGATGTFAPVIEKLRVKIGTAQRQAVDPPAPGEEVEIRLAAEATEVTVTYLATGVMEPSAGSAPGRALGLVTPLRLVDGNGLRAVEVRGVWVDNLGCVDGAGRMTACGRGTPLGWETSSDDADLVDVVAQLTLPVG